MRWIEIDRSTGQYTDAMEVPGGAVLRSHHYETSMGDEGVSALSESIVFIPGVRVAENGTLVER